MFAPWLIVMMSASASLGLASAVDTTEPPDSTAGGDATVECVLPTAESTDTNDASDTTEAEATTETTTESAPAEAFFDSFCAHAVAVAEIDAALTGSPSRDGAEQFRVGMCAPDVELPDEEQAETNWNLFIGGTAQTDPVLGDQWLAAGVLDTYEPPATDGTAAVVEINPDALALLVAIDMEFIDTFHANETDWCADTAPVATTEP